MTFPARSHSPLTRDRHALPPSIAARTNGFVASTGPRLPSMRPPRLSIEEHLLCPDASKQNAHADAQAGDCGAPITVEMREVAFAYADYQEQDRERSVSPCCDERMTGRMRFQEVGFERRERGERLLGDVTRDSLELAREARGLGNLVWEEEGAVEEMRKRRWSARMSQTVFNLGRNARAKAGAWMERRKDSRAGASASHYQLNDASSTTTDRMAGMPNYDVDASSSLGGGEDGQPVTRYPTAVVSATRSTLAQPIYSIPALAPAHLALTRPPSELIPATHPDNFTQQLLRAFRRRETRGELEPSSMERAFELAPGNRTCDRERIKATVLLRRQTRRAQVDRDARFERATTKCRSGPPLLFRSQSDPSAQPTPAPRPQRRETAAAFGAEFAAVAGLVMGQASGNIAFPL